MSPNSASLDTNKIFVLSSIMYCVFFGNTLIPVDIYINIHLNTFFSIKKSTTTLQIFSKILPLVILNPEKEPFPPITNHGPTRIESNKIGKFHDIWKN